MRELTYRSDIQGLRAIAVLAVMVFHFNPNLLPGGFIGVDVFLVISGFLITSILLKKKNQPNYSLGTTLKYFYSSRLKRIAPAYFVMLVLVGLVSAVFLIPKDFDTFKSSLEKAAWFNSNNYFASFGDYFAPANHELPLLHTWSLAVEVQFYLLAPLLVLLLPIKVLKWVLSALLIGMTVIAEYRLRVLGIEQATYYSLYARLPEFFAGCLAALLLNSSLLGCYKGHSWLGLLGLGMILLAAVLQPRLGYFPGLLALIPALGAVMLLISPSQGVIKNLLSNKVLVWLGGLSYSLYLWHWPVLAVIRYYTGAETLDFRFSLLFLILTFGLSTVSYYWVELTFRARGKRLKQTVGWAILIAAIITSPQSMGMLNKASTPYPLPVEYLDYANPAAICHGQIVADCLQGDLNSDYEVLLLGDSHAAMLNHFFGKLGKDLGFKARIITASSCVTIPGFDYQRISAWAHQACLEQIEAAKKFIVKSDVIFIAGMWSYQAKSKEFKKAFSNFLNDNYEKRIIVLSQVPRFKHNVVRIRRFLGLGLYGNLARDESYKEANNSIEEITKKYTNVDFLWLDKISLFDEAPFYKDKLIYIDGHHINEVGARAYAGFVTPLFKDILIRN